MSDPLLIQKFWWAQQGQPVVCVNDRVPEGDSRRLHLVRGRIYTVRTCIPVTGEKNVSFDGLVDAALTVRLQELANPHARAGGFDIRRFRPVWPRRQQSDLALFRSLIAASPSRTSRQSQIQGQGQEVRA